MRLLGQEVTSVHLDDASGDPVNMTDLVMELGDLGNPTTVVDTTTLTQDESTARGGSRGGHSGTMTFKTDDGAASTASYKMLAAAIATKTAKTITVVAGNLTIAYEVIYSNIVVSFTRDEESPMALSYQQTGAIGVS